MTSRSGERRKEVKTINAAAGEYRTGYENMVAIGCRFSVEEWEEKQLLLTGLLTGK